MFQKIKAFLDNKNILILGFGKEGRSTLVFLKKHINYKSITIADKNNVIDVIPSDIKTIFSNDYMDTLQEYDVIIKSPGVVLKNCSQTVVLKTISQTSLFLLEFSQSTIGITGTKGKSTTTTLIYHILKETGLDVVLLGNIGIPPLDAIEKMSDNSIAVFEMSCHQLEFEKISPNTAIILNLFEDHLDHYITRENYIRAKENIFLHQKRTDTFIVNEDCKKQIEKSTSNVITIGKRGTSSYFINNSTINDHLEVPGDIALIGEHNLYNIAVAYAVCKKYRVSDIDFIRGLKSYKPLPHRLEYVATKNGVDYYDDSISTVPETTIQAIKSLKRLKTVIIGGMDRGIDYSPLIDYLASNPVQNVILLPNTGRRIGDELKMKNVPFSFVNTLEDAVKLAALITPSGSDCVLSPAAASYGFFNNFEERGDRFKEFVNNL